MFKWLRIAFLTLLVSASCAYAALPGAHRALTPKLFGLTQIEPGLYTDAALQGDELLSLYKNARMRSEAFFGAMHASPRIIMCTTQDCANLFDIKPLGLAYGAHLVLLGPKGVNEMILTHELAHIQLHSEMGLQDLFKQRIPAWFDEGLASYIAADPRLRKYAPAEAEWIMQAQSFRDWGRMHQTYAWQETYGAAKSLVTDLQDRLGDDGLRLLIRKALENGDFAAP